MIQNLSYTGIEIPSIAKTKIAQNEINDIKRTLLNDISKSFIE